MSDPIRQSERLFEERLSRTDSLLCDGLFARLDQAREVNLLELGRPSEHVLIVVRSGTGRAHCSGARTSNLLTLIPGSCSLIPAGTSSRWSGCIPQTAVLWINASILNDVAEEVYGAESCPVGLRAAAGVRDDFLWQLASVLIDEIQGPYDPARRIIAESASRAISAHLLRDYLVSNFVEHRRHGLSEVRLARVIEHIEQHIDSKISLDALADAAALSRFHFTRVFKAALGVSPMIYIERCRIDAAKEMLQEGNCALQDIARRVGFSDQSHFTRRFRLHTGLTPASFVRTYAAARSPRRQLIQRN